MIRQRATAMASIANRGRLFGPTLNYQFPTMAEVLPPQIQFARASAAWRYNSAGMPEAVTTDVPRFDYVPESATEMNFFTESEFRNGVSDAPTRGNVTADTMSGYAGALLLSASGGVVSYAYKPCPYLRPGKAAIFTAVVEAQDDLGPPVLGSNSNADLGVIIAGADAASFIVVPLGGRLYEIQATRVIQLLPLPILGNNGIVKRVGTSTRAFKVTAYQIGLGATRYRYWPTTTVVRGNATPRGLQIEEQRTNAFWPSMTITPDTLYYDVVGANNYFPGQNSKKYLHKGVGGPPCSPNGSSFNTTGPKVGWMVVEASPETNGPCSFRMIFYRTTAPATIMFGGLVSLTTGIHSQEVGSGTGVKVSGVRKLADVGPNGGAVYLMWIVYTNPDAEALQCYAYPVAENVAGRMSIVHHVQLEDGWFPTSLITTVTAAQTRAAENPLVPKAGWYSPLASSMVMKLGPGTLFSNVTSGTAPFYSTICLTGGTTRGTFGLAGNGSVGGDVQTLGRYSMQSYPEAGDLRNATLTTRPTTEGGTFVVATDGVTQVGKASGVGGSFTLNTDMKSSLPKVTHLRMQPQINGWIESFKYFPRMLSTQEINSEAP